MRVSIIDGRIVGFNTISEQAILWNTTPAAIRQMLNRGLIDSNDYICLKGDKSQHNVYFFAEDLEKPTRKTKTGSERKQNAHFRVCGRNRKYGH